MVTCGFFFLFALTFFGLIKKNLSKSGNKILFRPNKRRDCLTGGPINRMYLIVYCSEIGLNEELQLQLHVDRTTASYNEPRVNKVCLIFSPAVLDGPIMHVDPTRFLPVFYREVLLTQSH